MGSGNGASKPARQTLSKLRMSSWAANGSMGEQHTVASLPTTTPCNNTPSQAATTLRTQASRSLSSLGLAGSFLVGLLLANFPGAKSSQVGKASASSETRKWSNQSCSTTPSCSILTARLAAR